MFGSVTGMEKLWGRAQISVHHLLAICRAGRSFGIRKFEKQKVCKWDLAGMNENCLRRTGM